ncbi:organic cation transporter protein-like isoform X1 [Galleria mellonella]|uniref:Organic cation transporter protein-like isoform X1 n=2 Tax=Galleria mellonella TaxID=7137 RepID=A0A6J1WFR0_GALME|nr:organic cation transporter protein-like isoform X1 [Galleria mellonella]
MTEEDPIEKAIGRFGKYQTWILFLILLGRSPTDFQLNNVVFLIPSVDYKCLDEEANNATNYCPCRQPEYDRNTIINSVTSEWNLICEKKYLASLAQSMLQVGILAGSLTYGYISDRYGRKIGTLIAVFSNALFIAISALLAKFWIFMIFRFLIGTAVGGTMLCGYILIIELSGKSFRPYLIGLYEISFIIGYTILPVIAYFIRDWRKLQLITSVPWLLVIIYYWLIPESPRWLITVGKKKEAVDILSHIAKKNNRSTENIEIIVDEIEKETMREKQKHGTYFDLFKTPKIRIYTIITALVWMFCSHTFYGINQYIGRLQGNIYLNVLLSAACLAPGLFIVVITTLFLKRKVGVLCTFSVAGIALLIFIFIPTSMEWLTLVFAIIGQIGAYTSFVQVYLFTSEVFPTVVRNSAMGFSSMFGRFGGFIAPFVVNIGVEWGSILVFSTVAFSAAILCYFLPETKDTILLNSIEQTETSNVRRPSQEITV